MSQRFVYKRRLENRFIKIVKLWQNINFITKENKSTQLKCLAWKSSKFEPFNVLFAVVCSPHMKATFLRNRFEPYLATAAFSATKQHNSKQQSSFKIKFHILWTHDNNSTQQQHYCNSMNVHVQFNYSTVPAIKTMNVVFHHCVNVQETFV